jgi:hypothetical protein
MTKLTLLALLAACDAGVPKSKPEPVKKMVEVPVAPSDAAIVPEDAAAPTPAMAGARLQRNHFDLPPQAECARTRLVLKLIDKSKNVLDEYKESSTCTGACTAQEKREGEEQVAHLEQLIEADKASPGELDYNFTSCLETGLGTSEVVRNVGGRDVALLEDRYTGPHDGVYTRYKIALEVCGKIYVSGTFGEMQSHSWPREQLEVMSEKPDEIIVFGTGDDNDKDHSGALIRLRMPACPGAPAEDTFDIWNR